MHLYKLWEWMKKWDIRRTVYVFLVVDTLLAEVQVLWFFAFAVWYLREEYSLQTVDTIQSSDESGFSQNPSYSTIRTYFIVIGALITRIFTNWILFDGLLTGLTSHIRAGIIGTGSTTLYISVGGFIFWIHQFLYFKLQWWLMALMLFGFVVYAAVSMVVLVFVWREQASERLQMQSHHVSASIILVCGVFIGFVHFKILFWVLFNVVFNFNR